MSRFLVLTQKRAGVLLGPGNENDINSFFGTMLSLLVTPNLGSWNWVMRIWLKSPSNYEICLAGEKLKYFFHVKRKPFLA